jgi:uncharacterized protein YndB with AHSA1/START domain
MTDTSPETRSVVIERELAHPPEKVWRALTQPQLIAEWLMKNDFLPEVGRRFAFPADWGTVECEVLEVEPNRSLSYSWASRGLDSTVTWTLTPTLTPTGTGTRLRVEQSGFRPEQQPAYAGAKAGWPRFLARLEQLLARPDVVP